MTDDKIMHMWALDDSTTIIDFARAIIAARDEELRKQEPKAVWLQMSNETGFPSRVNSEAHLCAIKHPDFTVENLYLTPKPPHDEASLKALYTAPMPTPSQQARPLDEWDEWNGNVLWWKFPIDEPPYVGTPLDTDWPKYHTHWTPLGVPDMPLPARPDEVTKNDRNKDGAIEFIDAVVLNKPIWPNPWGQDVAFVAFVIHSDRQRITELEAELREAKGNYLNACGTVAKMHEAAVGEIVWSCRGVVEDVADLKASADKMRKCLEAIAEHHEAITDAMNSDYHTKWRDFAREGLK